MNIQVYILLMRHMRPLCFWPRVSSCGTGFFDGKARVPPQPEPPGILRGFPDSEIARVDARPGGNLLRCREKPVIGNKQRIPHTSSPESPRDKPSAWQSFPGPLHRSSSRLALGRFWLIHCCPERGSSARISTHCGTSSGWVTRFRQQYIP